MIQDVNSSIIDETLKILPIIYQNKTEMPENKSMK